MKRAAALLAHPEGASRLFRKPMGVNELYDSLPGNCSFQVNIVIDKINRLPPAKASQMNEMTTKAGMSRGATPRSAGRGFTLVELLVVIAIVSMLISLLMPSVQSAMKSAEAVKCFGNLRELGTACLVYGTDNNGYMPNCTVKGWPNRPPDTDSWLDWMAQLPQAGLISDTTSYICPTDNRIRKRMVGGKMTQYSYGYNHTLGDPNFDAFEAYENANLHYIHPKRMPVMPIIGDATEGAITGRTRTFRARLASANGPQTYYADDDPSLIRHREGSNVYFVDGHAEEVSYDRAMFGYATRSFNYTPGHKPYNVWWW